MSISAKIGEKLIHDSIQIFAKKRIFMIDYFIVDHDVADEISYPLRYKILHLDQ